MFGISNALFLLKHYKYFLIFPVAIVEGPIVILISGFLVYLGVLNPFIVFILLVIADVIGDCLYYTIGRHWRNWRWIKRYTKFIGYNEKSEAFLEKHFKNHKGKTFLLAKFSHGIGGAVQVSAGIARVNFLEFVAYSFIGTTPKTLVLLLLGYYAGASYIKIDNLFNYIAYFTITITALVLLIYFFMGKYIKGLLLRDDVDK